MLNNSSGKVITIFVIITALLLLTITAISLFYLKVESEGRQMAEARAVELQAEKARIEGELKEAQKQNYLLEEKNKEADERINGLLDELELEKGLREEMKIENSSLKAKLEEAVQEKEQVRQTLTSDIEELQQKVDELESQVELQLNQLEEKKAKEQTAKGTSADTAVKSENAQQAPKSDDPERSDQKVELEKIVVNPAVEPEQEIPVSAQQQFLPVSPERIPEGRILTVDVETEFVVVNLGGKDGIVEDMFMSVYRGSHYLGDIRVTRVQPDMSAADLIPPFSSQMVRKNDQVIAK